MLETVRRRLRELVKLIEVKRRTIVYSDFEDEIGPGAEILVSGVPVGTDMDRFRANARQFLRANLSHIAVLKLHRNEPLTPTDLSELERIFTEAGISSGDELERVRADGGLGLFVRSLIGLDRAAAKRAFDGFCQGRGLTAHPAGIRLVDMIVDHLTERGAMDPHLLYESPIHRCRPARRGRRVQRGRGCSARPDFEEGTGKGGCITQAALASVRRVRL